MNRLILFLILLLSSNLYAGRPFIGFEGGAISIDEDAYFGKYTKEIIKGLNGRISYEKSGIASIGFYEGYEVNDYVSLIAKQRYFSTRIAADFYSQPSMNFEIAKNVVPLNIGVRLRLKLDKVFGFYLEGLPGVYIVDTFEKGYFGNYHTRDNYFGGNISGGVDFIINDLIEISLGATVEILEIEKKNPILEDGGDAGGVGIAMKFGVVF